METENFKHLYNVLNNEIKRIEPMYDRQADYQTNSKSYYDYLAKLKKLFELLSNRIWEYDEELKKRFEEWDKLIEKFPENVEKLLIEWLEDGTLEEIINVNIFEDLNNKIEEYKNELNKKIENNTKEINEKIEKLKNELNQLINDSVDELSNLIILINNKLNHFIVNIEEFEGSDTERIQKALDKAESYGGGVVYVPKHKYVLDDCLRITKNVTLYSELGTYYERTTSNYMLANGKEGDNFSRYQGNGNIKIINGIFDGKAQENFDSVGSNFLFAHADGIVIKNVELRNANSHHIEINSSKNVLVTNCKILGQLESLNFVEGIQLDLSSENSYAGFGLYDNTPCQNVRIEKCLFDKSNDLPSVSRAFGSHNQRIGGYMENISFIGNVINNCRDFGIQLKGYKNTYIKNNVLKNCVGGMIFYASDENSKNIYDEVVEEANPIIDLFIENNIFDNITKKQMCYSYGREKSRNKNIIMQGNTLKNTQNTNGCLIGIYTDNIKIINNNIEKVNMVSINIQQCKYCFISQNNVLDNGDYSAIRVLNSSEYIQIINNSLQNIGGNGINILENFNNVVVSGNFINGCNTLDNSYDAIYMHSTGKKVNISNNIITNGFDAIYESAMYCTESVTGVRMGKIADKGNIEETYRTTNMIDKGDI